MKKIVDDVRLMAQISDMYYNQDIDQKMIAKQLGLSRPTISRLITNAKEKGIVKIEIRHLGNTQYVDLERKIEKYYGLEDVILAPSFDAIDQQRASIGQIAAQYLNQIIKDGDVIGISMGHTLNEMVNHAQYKEVKDVLFIPLLGGLGLVRTELHSNSLVERMAQLYHGSFMLMHAPARVSTARICRQLMHEKGVVETIRKCDELDIAIVGIGYPDETSSMMSTGFYDKEDIQRNREKKVAGDIAMQMYDINGDTKAYKADNTVVGLDIKKLRKVPYSVGVAGGLSKLSAIQGAIAGKYINVLITDVECGKQLIALKEKGEQ